MSMWKSNAAPLTKSIRDFAKSVTNLVGMAFVPTTSPMTTPTPTTPKKAG